MRLDGASAGFGGAGLQRTKPWGFEERKPHCLVVEGEGFFTARGGVKVTRRIHDPVVSGSSPGLAIETTQPIKGLHSKEGCSGDVLEVE